MTEQTKQMTEQIKQINQTKIYLHSLGCDKNLVDSEIMLGLLYEAGYKSESDPSQAEIIIVNTCGFIQDAVEEGIETILELSAHKETGHCKTLIATGCMAQRYQEEIKAEIPEVDIILGANNYPNIVNAIAKLGSIDETINKNVDETINENINASINANLNANLNANIDVLDDELFKKRINTMPFHVAYVKISEGCDNRCTYCAIPDIKGPYRDRKFESIIEECAHLVKNGARELVLVAQDTAKYGTALYGKPRLHELLMKISRIDDLGWVRVMYTYPEHIYPQLIETIAKHEKICNYIDMPIQHSHPDVIARMDRKDADLTDLIDDMQEKGIVIRTTLIAGFPGETEKEYQHLRKFIEEVRFDHLGVFAYSKEDKTPAAKMKPQIKAGIKKARQQELMMIQAKIAEEKGQSLIGQVLKVMVDGSVGLNSDVESDFGPAEKTVGELAYSGRSDRYAYDVDGAVFFPSPVELISGDFVSVKITKAKGYDLYGELEVEPIEA